MSWLLNDLYPLEAIKTDMLESSETAMWLLQSTGCPRDPEISYASSSQKNHRQKTSKIQLMITCNFPSLRPAPCRIWNFEETNISLENHMQVSYILFFIFRKPCQVLAVTASVLPSGVNLSSSLIYVFDSLGGLISTDLKMVSFLALSSPPCLLLGRNFLRLCPLCRAACCPAWPNSTIKLINISWKAMLLYEAECDHGCFYPSFTPWRYPSQSLALWTFLLQAATDQRHAWWGLFARAGSCSAGVSSWKQLPICLLLSLGRHAER